MMVKYPAPRRWRRAEQPDGGAAEAQAALTGIIEAGLGGRRLGFLSGWDAEQTTYFDVFGEEPGDR